MSKSCHDFIYQVSHFTLERKISERFEMMINEEGLIHSSELQKRMENYCI
jgi:hypothetical protein